MRKWILYAGAALGLAQGVMAGTMPVQAVNHRMSFQVQTMKTETAESTAETGDENLESAAEEKSGSLTLNHNCGQSADGFQAALFRVASAKAINGQQTYKKEKGFDQIGSFENLQTESFKKLVESQIEKNKISPIARAPVNKSGPTFENLTAGIYYLRQERNGPNEKQPVSFLFTVPQGSSWEIYSCTKTDFGLKECQDKQRITSSCPPAESTVPKKGDGNPGSSPKSGSKDPSDPSRLDRSQRSSARTGRHSLWGIFTGLAAVMVFILSGFWILSRNKE